MKNIVLTRIDERLIHGQVITSWLKLASPNTIVVMDDMSAGNAFAKRILFAAAPKDIDMKVLSVADAIEYLKGEHENERVFVMAKVPGPVLTAIKQGVEFKEVNLGNMGGGPGRNRFNKNVNASPQEVAEFKEIVEAGVPVYAQMVPTDAKIDLKSLL